MRRILVVDDDLHTRLAIRAWLQPIVAIADGGLSGLVALDRAAFDLMIGDILMPNMRGFESIRRFHTREPAVPLIAISGHAFSGPETDHACLKMGSASARRGACASRSGRQRCWTSSTNACGRPTPIEDMPQPLPLSGIRGRTNTAKHCH
jgi:CheY-like chemotaxis protein